VEHEEHLQGRSEKWVKVKGATELVTIPSKRGSRQHTRMLPTAVGASLGGAAMAGAQIWREWIPRCDPLREEVGRRHGAALLAGKANSGRPRKRRGGHGR
jgi:hypothetical protein